ncbi:MAG: class II aldolase/adducin family protein [Bacteroidota bacterium]
MEHSRSDIAAGIVLVCHRLSLKGFVTAQDGNVSARIPNGNILVTPSSVNKGSVTEGILVEVTPDGSPVTLGRKASTELGMHLFIYRERQDVQAVVHAHPTYATGFAAARVPIPSEVFPEVIIGLGAIPLAPYATPSTREVADSLAPFVHSSDAILMSNHGVVAYGSDLENAYYKLEKVEHVAHMTFIARMLGGEHHLSEQELHKLLALRGSVYGKTVRPAASPTLRMHEEKSDPSEMEIKQLIRTVLAETRKTHP